MDRNRPQSPTSEAPQTTRLACVSAVTVLLSAIWAVSIANSLPQQRGMTCGTSKTFSSHRENAQDHPAIGTSIQAFEGRLWIARHRHPVSESATDTSNNDADACPDDLFESERFCRTYLFVDESGLLRNGLGLPTYRSNAASFMVALPLGWPTLLAWSAFLFLFTRHARQHWLRRDGACGECGYPLTGNASGRCPECGAAVIESSSQPGSAST